MNNPQNLLHFPGQGIIFHLSVQIFLIRFCLVLFESVSLYFALNDFDFFAGMFLVDNWIQNVST